MSGQNEMLSKAEDIADKVSISEESASIQILIEHFYFHVLSAKNGEVRQEIKTFG